VLSELFVILIFIKSKSYGHQIELLLFDGQNSKIQRMFGTHYSMPVETNHKFSIQQFALIIIVLAFISVVFSNNYFSAKSSSADESLNAKPIITPTSKLRTIAIGSYVYGGIWQGLGPIENFERKLNKKLEVVHWFMSWNHEWNEHLVTLASTAGRKPLISWEPHKHSMADIAAGKYDNYIRSWAKGSAKFGKVIYLRPFPEMNGNWTPWNGDPESFVVAWRRMVEIFRQEGANNVVWIWAPNITDQPNSERNRMENYYPGSDYVDILAMDGYNWGTSRKWSSWKSFSEIFSEPYKRIAALGNQEIWITEMSSAEIGGNKGLWIKDMFEQNKFQRLSTIIWFDENKEVDWRVQSSKGSLEAFRRGVKGESPNYFKSLK